MFNQVWKMASVSSKYCMKKYSWKQEVFYQRINGRNLEIASYYVMLEQHIEIKESSADNAAC